MPDDERTTTRVEEEQKPWQESASVDRACASWKTHAREYYEATMKVAIAGCHRGTHRIELYADKPTTQRKPRPVMPTNPLPRLVRPLTSEPFHEWVIRQWATALRPDNIVADMSEIVDECNRRVYPLPCFPHSWILAQKGKVWAALGILARSCLQCYDNVPDAFLQIINCHLI